MEEKSADITQLEAQKEVLMRDSADLERASPPKETTKQRAHFIDWLRVSLTVLVIIHHSFFIFVGGWWPVFGLKVDPEAFVTGVFVLEFNQAFFMGLFFFLAGLFVTKSYDKKGSDAYLKDRAIRLLIPFPVYELIIAPMILQIAAAVFTPTATFSEVYLYYFQTYQFANNPLWFVILLFHFDLFYFLARMIPLANNYYKNLSSATKVTTPYDNKEFLRFLLQAGFAMATLTFFVRIVCPVMFWIPVFGQIAFLPQYSMCYVFGTIASETNFIQRIPSIISRWCILAALLVYAVKFTVRMITWNLYSEQIGGFTGLSFFISLFDMNFAILFSIGLLGLFRDFFNMQPKELGKRIIGSAYTAYIIHPLIVIPLAIGLYLGWPAPTLVLILFLALISIPCIFGLAILVKMIPGTERVL